MATIYKVGKKWRGKISVRGNQVHVGMFPTRKAAQQACEDALLEANYTFYEDIVDDTTPWHKKFTNKLFNLHARIRDKFTKN